MGALQPLDHRKALDADIIAFCQAALARTALDNDDAVQGAGCLLSDPRYDAKVVKLSSKAVVKFGRGLSPDEAANQAFAYLHTGRKLRVPEVYRFFQAKDDGFGSIGYLVMECMDGTSLAKLPWSGQSAEARQGIISRLVAAIGELSAVRVPPGSAPGPLTGGRPRGYVWSDEGADTSFASVSQLEGWIDRRLTLGNRYKKHFPKTDFSPFPLIMCHMDLARRNIMLLQDGAVCLVDWAFAGFFPSLFEIYTIKSLRARDPDFSDELLRALTRQGVAQEQMEQLAWLEFINMLTRSSPLFLFH
ncbi:MAG: hypothetical protein M1832_005131 [Thelocarpon impressellum]|nr:MAG: hypothetical protein M1832_005131 [Thelocarpon impressellum]